MTLTGARVARSATSAERIDLKIRHGRIEPRGGSSGDRLELNLDGYLILPGLINCHDHLEFNLFPRLGRGPYPNAKAWADDIYHPDRSPIKEHLAVPKAVRLAWGGLKNLLSGVTTVAHHNPYDASVFDNGFPVRVVKRFGWAHSLQFSPDLVSRYRAVSQRWPFLIHAAEGTDTTSAAEIQQLEGAGVLSSRTVLVHGVGIDRQSLQILLRRKVSLIWCPTSNLFTLSQTLRPDVLRSKLPTCLGTDSALTGQGDMACELTVACKAGGLTAEEIYPMVTTRAATTLHLNRGEGEIRAGWGCRSSRRGGFRTNSSASAATTQPGFSHSPRPNSTRLQRLCFPHRPCFHAPPAKAGTGWPRDLPHQRRRVCSVRRDGSRSGAGLQAGRKAGADMNPILDSLPVLILYPHSRCNCRCVMCDIWKTDSTREISAAELERHAEDIALLSVEWVVFSGGEPLMHSDLFRLCRFLHERNIRTTLLSTGLLIERHADQIVDCLDDLIVILLDGPPETHDADSDAGAGSLSYAGRRCGRAASTKSWLRGVGTFHSSKRQLQSFARHGGNCTPILE